jgi:hypothetical protein
MRRHILGVLSATLAAPYLVVFLWHLFALLFGDEVGIREPFDLIKAIPMGTIALFLFGLPLLTLAIICAAFVNAFDSSSWHGSVLWGFILGLGFMIALFVRSLEYSFQVTAFLVSGSISGAICGWIYWRIAIRQTPERPHAIDPA